MDLDDKPRPTCNCKTSLCVQRYCHCFDNQWFCSDACRCSESCRNTQINEAFVEERIEITLRTKPRAFESKGCSCRKSECKKNYCECFKNRVACTERCKCEGCANTHGAKGDAWWQKQERYCFTTMAIPAEHVKILMEHLTVLIHLTVLMDHLMKQQ
ncbi:hypothetical protein QOZ80_1AG0029420 [Eleusine coracana subsp. coracana]|nr:hypothetical protein QOZ80_1AG0029420 [Eleusine coracana subsp. coracana]